MSFNVGNFFNKLVDRASSFSNSLNVLLSKTDGKNNSSLTPSFSSFGNKQQTDSLFRKLAMNYAPAAQQETTSIRNVEVPTKLNSDGTFTAAISRRELGIKGKWQAVDPHKVSELAYKKAVITLGITTDETEAKTIAQKAHSGGITMKYGNLVRPVKETDFADRAFINQSVDKLSNYILTIPKDQVEAIYTAAESVVGKERADAARLKNGFPVVTQKTEADMALAGGAGLMFRLPLPIVLGGILVGSTIYTATQMHETMRDNHLSGERANSMPIPTFNMEDAGDAPPASRPTDTADRPTQPKVDPIAGPETQTGQEIAVRPNAPPATAKTKAKSNLLEGTPQPYTPDVPKGTQEPPPKNFDPRLIPPIVIGGTALTKLTLDKLSETEKAELQKAGHTLSSLPPDANRLPSGTPADTNKVPRNPDEARNIEDLKYENKSALLLSQAGYKVDQNPTLTEQDLLQEPSLRSTANPDYRIEGEIFDCISPTANRPLNIYTKVANKVSGGQATRIIVNLERSDVSLDELKQVFMDTPMRDLKEIMIVTKDKEILKFFPFEK